MKEIDMVTEALKEEQEVNKRLMHDLDAMCEGLMELKDNLLRISYVVDHAEALLDDRKMN